MARLGGLAHLTCEYCKTYVGCPITAVSADRSGQRVEVDTAPLDRHYRTHHYDEVMNRLRAERKDARREQAEADTDPRTGSLLGVSWT